MMQHDCCRVLLSSYYTYTTMALHTLAQQWAEYVSNTTATVLSLQPVTLPLSSFAAFSSLSSLSTYPLAPLEQLIAHLSSTPVHATYYPLLRFGVLHASRLALVWAKLTKGREGKVSYLQDLTGYLCLCCECSSIVYNLILSLYCTR